MYIYLYINILYIYINVDWMLSKNKERLQKKLMKFIKILLKEREKQKSINMLVNVTEIFLKNRKTKSEIRAADGMKIFPED